MVTRIPREDDQVDRREATVIHEEGVTPVTPVRAVDPVVPVAAAVDAPAAVHRESVVADYAAERYATLNRANQLITFIVGLIIGLIAIRVVLRLIAANPDNAFAQFIYGITAPFVGPFLTLTGTPSFEGAVLEIPSLVAIIVYALLGWALAKLMWILFYRPATRDVSTTTYRHS
jgi:uncharacterized protein YggT (Ycf19 family)